VSTCASSGSISHFRGEARAQQGGAHGVSQLGLGQQEEVVVTPRSPDAKRGDEPRLRRQQQRIEHACLRVTSFESMRWRNLLGARALDTDERARAVRGAVRNQLPSQLV
jgi:SRSO17 transposase